MSTLPQPILQFRFDRINNQNQVMDFSKNALNGAVKNGCALVNDPDMGKCLEFDGKTGQMELPPLKLEEGFSFGKGFTICVWARFEELTPYACLVDLGNGKSKDNILLQSHGNPTGLNGNIYHSIEGKAQVLFTEKGLKVHNWHHIAFTVNHEGNAQLFLDGVPVDGPTTAKETFIPKMAERKVCIIGNNNWTDMNHHFKGRMAWFNVYPSALSPGQVQQDMALRVSEWRRSFPIDFSLQTHREGVYAPVLFMEHNSTGQEMYLEIRNTGNAALYFNSTDTKKACLQLRFRPGVLSKAFLQKTLLANSSDGISWTLTDETRTDTGVVLLNFTPSQALQLNSGDVHTIIVPNVSVDPTGGARATNVEFHYNGFTPDASGKPVLGNRLQQLSLVNHSGQRNLPLHAHIVGPSTVLNDGKTANELKLRIVNPTHTTIHLSGNENAPSALIITLPGQPEGQNIEWALAEMDHLTKVKVKQGDTSITADASQESHVTFKALITNLSALKPQQALEFSLSEIITGLPSGRVEIRIAYQNIPGYWDGGWTVSVNKGPMVFRTSLQNDKAHNFVGVGTLQPQSPLEISGHEITDSGKKAALTIQNTVNTGGTWFFRIGAEGTTTPNGGLSFANNNRYVMHMTDDGKVGIDTNDPQGKLHVSGNKSALIVDGKVGIGTTAPSESLHIKKDDKYAILLEGKNTGVGIRDTGEKPSTFKMYNNKGWGIWQDQGNSSGSKLFISQQNGNVGIGTNAPNENAKLQVKGQIWDDSGQVMPKGGIIMWSGKVNDIPSGWKLCDGNFGTPDLRNRFIAGAGGKYNPGYTHGHERVSLSKDQMPPHQHFGFGENLTWHMGSQKGGQEGSSGGQDRDNRYYGSSWAGGVASNEDSRFSDKFKGTTRSHENRPPFHALCFIMKV